jgi:hypothetical protein
LKLANWAWRSPEFSLQTSFNEVVKFSLTRWIELIAEAGPFARSIEQNQTGNGVGGLALGLQGVVYHGEAARPTIAMSYLRQVYGGDTPDLDIGSATNSFLFLASADLKGFHYDANLFLQRRRRQRGSPYPVRADARGLACPHKEVRPLRRNMAFHPAVATRRCRCEPLDFELQLAKKLRDRRGIQPWTYEHLYPVGDFLRIHVFAA